MDGYDSLHVRPYELMYVLSKLGNGETDDLGDDRLNEIYGKVRENPETPVTLRCNASEVYRYQDPGTREDTPEGALYNRKRDIDILQRMGLVPGATGPARDLFARLFSNIPTARGILRYDSVTSPEWEGCSEAICDGYDRAVAAGMTIFFPDRDDEVQKREEAVRAGRLKGPDKLRLLPGHCLRLAFILRKGDTNRAKFEDVIAAIERRPDIPIELAEGSDLLCLGCYAFQPESTACLGDATRAELRAYKHDLDVLQKCGLAFGDVVRADELFDLIVERIDSVGHVFAWGDWVERSCEWKILPKYKSEDPQRPNREG